MVQRRGGCRFAKKPLDRDRVVLLLQHLDGDLSTQMRIERAIDRSHPTFAEEAEDAVPADSVVARRHSVHSGLTLALVTAVEGHR